jgi:hypothetical protein
MRTTVAVLRANGNHVASIAVALNLDEDTLRKHYPIEIAAGADELEAVLGSVVARAGLAGDANAAMRWLARHGSGRWRPPAAQPAADRPADGMSD